MQDVCRKRILRGFNSFVSKNELMKRGMLPQEAAVGRLGLKMASHFMETSGPHSLLPLFLFSFLLRFSVSKYESYYFEVVSEFFLCLILIDVIAEVAWDHGRRDDYEGAA